MRNARLTYKRNSHIVKRFNALSDIKTPNGKRKYTYDYIFEKLSEQFYLEPLTIERIVKNHE